ncbi:MAG: BspA family leucine-rich repeat surface protein, partial [Oscillospiraceae bacterium]|nr:BspA family leucine-rich repeat surface protein [Oscillospiraceae bacterium]
LDLSTWDVSNVTNMSFMFENMSNLTNLDVSNWDVSSVTNVNSMFNGLTVEELDLSTWDVSNVTNVSNMNGMFNGLTVENLDIFHWDISNVTNITASTNIGSIFRGLAIENLDLSNWDVSNVTNMSNMFRGASGPTRIGNLDLSNWDVSNVTNMSNMFRGASGIRNLDVSSWDVSNVTNMSEMFRGASSLESLDLSDWDTNSLSSSGMRDIFNGVYSLRKLVLGQNFQFHETTSSSSSLPIGIWQNVGTGTINNPNGQHRLTSQELMNTFNGATMADIFVWRPSVVIRVTEEIMPGNCSMGWCWGVTSAPDSLWFDIEETLHGAFSGRVYMTHDQTAQGIRSHHIDIIIELEIEYDGQEFIFSVVDTPLFDIEWHWYESSSGGWNARRNTNMFSDIRIVTRQEGNGFVIDRRYVRDITFNWDRHWMEGEDFLIYGDWQQETWPEPPLTALIYEPTEEPHGLSYGVTLRLLDEEGELLRRTGSAFEIVDLNRPTLWGTGEANLPTRKPSYNECLSGSSSMHMLFYVVLRRRISRDWMDDRNV